MSRLSILTRSKAQTTVENLYKDLERRIIASPPGLCPVDISSSYLKMCHAQTCGKCTPCRVGLGQLGSLLESVLDGEADLETIELIEKTARVIANSSDCAIGYEAAEMVLKGLNGFKDDYEEHVLRGRCLCHIEQPVPCVSLCPAGVDVPGYVALVGDGRYDDAVRLIRKDNPFPIACALVCEHPCEARCRRNMIDDSINIRGLKRIAVDLAGNVPNPENSVNTSKKVAVIGGGPSGLSAAYYLQLMGHNVTVYEKRKRLGGMLAYGIPNYRLPIERLEEDINNILNTGVKIEIEKSIGSQKDEIHMDELRKEFDAVYISIGAHVDKKLGIDKEDAKGVMSAVELLRNIGDGVRPDFTGKTVVVIGGGNVAMDVCRSSVRLGAKKVNVVYRRRIVDMTALAQEIDGAIAEGINVMELHAPEYIETDDNNNVVALQASPKMVGLIDRGRPKPQSTGEGNVRIPCDIVIVAVGQGIETPHFEDAGIPIKRGGIDAAPWSAIENNEGVFAGGDCVTGPATVIRAIAAGKVAAANIDNYLGFDHIISTDVVIPEARLDDRTQCGRVNMTEREADERINDFELTEEPMSLKEAKQEASRCLRCDYFGYGVFKGGRISQW